MQQRAVCFECDEVIEHSPIFEAPCGHQECPSGVFHGDRPCLMVWRDRRDEILREASEW